MPTLYFEVDGDERCPVAFGGRSDVLVYFLYAGQSMGLGTQVDKIDGVVNNLHRMLQLGGFVLVGHHLPKQMSFGRFIRCLDDARALFESHGFALRVALDVTNELDRDHAGDPVGRSIYFLAHTVQRT